MSYLEIDSVNFSYSNSPILSNIYLKVSIGEITGFVGRNGCGKSTLLKVIFGTLRGGSQSVRISGKYYSLPFQSGLIKFLPQDGLFPNFLTARKAALLYDADLNALLDDSIFAKYIDFHFSHMSGGVVKYIEILILLNTPSEFVLRDEPFSYLAPVLVEKLIPTIRRAAYSKGILLTDHQYKSILEVSDKLYLLRDQCLYPISSSEELSDMGYINQTSTRVAHQNIS